MNKPSVILEPPLLESSPETPPMLPPEKKEPAPKETAGRWGKLSQRMLSTGYR